MFEVSGDGISTAYNTVKLVTVLPIDEDILPMFVTPPQSALWIIKNTQSFNSLSVSQCGNGML